MAQLTRLKSEMEQLDKNERYLDEQIKYMQMNMNILLQDESNKKFKSFFFNFIPKSIFTCSMFVYKETILLHTKIFVKYSQMTTPQPRHNH